MQCTERPADRDSRNSSGNSSPADWLKLESPLRALSSLFSLLSLSPTVTQYSCPVWPFQSQRGHPVGSVCGNSIRDGTASSHQGTGRVGWQIATIPLKDGALANEYGKQSTVPNCFGTFGPSGEGGFLANEPHPQMFCPSPPIKQLPCKQYL